MRIRDLPEEDRPREKALRYGFESCNDAEILSLIIGSGTKDRDVVQLSRELIANNHGLDGIAAASVMELCETKGVSLAKALSLRAAFALAERSHLQDKSSFSLFSPLSFYGAYREAFESLSNERLLLIHANKKGKIRREEIIALGNDKALLSSSKMIISSLLKEKTPCFALVHNHPSGLSLPSKEDLRSTAEIKAVADQFSLLFIDHIIISSEGYYSFRENGLLSNKAQ